MCCFSGPVEDVAATRIFARMSGPGRQLLAYEMVFAAATPVAMILALPVPAACGDDAARFVSLADYPALFDDLEEAFTWPGGPPRTLSHAADELDLPLAVHTVGAFVASFVPRLADFARLDPRFRLPPGTVERVPGYADFGFVVFQLDAARDRTRVHPMAFEFPTRDPAHLFFPLLHVHDGTLHAEATFDHALYAQGITGASHFEHRDTPLADAFVDRRAALVADLAAPLSRRLLTGPGPNRDAWAPLR